MTGQADHAARWALVCSVLDAVLDAPAGERLRILDERCAGDPALRDEVAALLQADTAIDHKLETPLFERAGALFDGDDAPPAPADPPPGETIGPWRLIQELGRGGMGAVWLAERADGAFEHRVALKLLKRGLDSDAILERFLAERQILARLQHPHIAHLIDGGVAADGRPYFAMERIEGEPITRWCDARRLPVRERLELFLAVADAVQYAHRQLVVHRDLKPSNILVTPQGEAKLLDFGIAKLLDADADRAEAQTLTQLGIRMLTPEYAAPEQLRGEAVTTSTDVYALGVLLYELLSGQRPPPAEADPAAAKPPPRPSTKATDDAAEARGTTRERLRRALRGDLDTIVLRAVHPAPERRYGSAEALGADIRRHLDRQPVQARPDSVRYRAGKFVARNRLAVVAASLVVMTLVGGIVATAWQAREARQQARRAEQVKDFLVTVFEAGSPQEWRGQEPTARELLDAGAKRVDEELAGDPVLHAEMLGIIGSLYVDLGKTEQAEPLLRRSLEQRKRLSGADSPDYADSLLRWSGLLDNKGDWREAEKAQTEALRIFMGRPGQEVQAASALRSLSLTKLMLGDAGASADLQEQALELHRRIHGRTHPSVADDLRLLGGLFVDQGRYREAAPLYAEALGIYRKHYGADSVRYAQAINAQAMLLQKQGELQRAASDFERAALIYRAASDPVNLEDALNHRGDVLCKLGRFDEGMRDLRSGLAVAKDAKLPQSRIGIRTVSLGECLARIGRLSEAESEIRRGLDSITAEVGDKHGWTPFAMARLAEVLAERGKPEEAEDLSMRALTLFEEILGKDSTWAAEGHRVIAAAHLASDRPLDALNSARQSLDILDRRNDLNDRQKAMSELQLAKAQLRLGDESLARESLERAAKTFSSTGDRPEAVTAMMLRGLASARLGDPNKGEALLREALGRRTRMYGSASGRTGEAELMLGTALVESRKNAREGLRMLASARAKIIQQMGASHASFGLTAPKANQQRSTESIGR